MADILASPLAFERCEGGTCGEPKTRDDDPPSKGKSVYCRASDDCAKGGCYCQLFKRKKDSDGTVPWEVPLPNQGGWIKHEPKKFDYKCLCVKPILEGKAETFDGIEYTMRFVLCGIGGCTLDLVPLSRKIKCSGDCHDKCKCTLFRLQIGGPNFDPKKAKWEYLAKTEEQIEPDNNYVYRCFCLK
jgi:hypothetical protein